jgi:tetratricopeptide (TPR) repeat protein
VLIASTREALTLACEHLLPVGPLATSDAVELFVDRATATRPGHAEVRADVVASICERLDGMPLAVELAAARTKALPVAQIAERLDKRFRLLTGGARTAVPRQQTLRAVVDWSYDLLFDDEKQVFARLATFVGGWTLEAAEAVCAGGTVTVDDVLDIVTALIDKSLVIADIDDAGDVRYRMLQTIAEYARERLAAATDVDDVRSRHASFFADLARRGEEGLTWIDGSTWRTRLNRDVENLRAAFDWLCETIDPRGLTMANDLALLWWARGDWAEGVRWADQAQTLAGALGQESDHVAVALQRTWRGLYATTIGEDPAEATSAVAHAVETIADAGDDRALLRAKIVFATMLSRHRDPGVHALAEAAIELATRRSERWYEGVGYALLAIYHVRLGHLSDAKDAAERAAAALASVRDTMTIFETHLVLATIAQLEDRLDDAATILDEMESSSRAAGIRHYEEWALARRGLVRLQAGDLETAALALGQAIEMAADPWADAYARLGSAMLRRRLADAEGAADHLDQALEIQTRIGGGLEQGYLHVLRGWLALDRADHKAAREHAEAATVAADGAATVESMATEVLAAAAALDGRVDDARPLLDRASSLAPMVGHPAWFLTRDDVAKLRQATAT